MNYRYLNENVITRAAQVIWAALVSLTIPIVWVVGRLIIAKTFGYNSIIQDAFILEVFLSLALIGTWVNVLPDHIVKRCARFSIPLRIVGLVYAVPATYAFLFFITRFISIEYLTFFSHVVIGNGCCKIEWAVPLQVVAYSSYIMFISSFMFICHKYIQKGMNKKLKNSALVTFVLCFPTYTTWSVERSCGGFGGGNCSWRDIPVITPLVMSENPLSVVFSLCVALSLCYLYFKYKKIPML